MHLRVFWLVFWFPMRRMETRPVLRYRSLLAHDAQVSEANSDFRVSELDAAHPGCIPLRRMGMI